MKKIITIALTGVLFNVSAGDFKDNEMSPQNTTSVHKHTVRTQEKSQEIGGDFVGISGLFYNKQSHIDVHEKEILKAKNDGFNQS